MKKLLLSLSLLLAMSLPLFAQQGTYTLSQYGYCTRSYNTDGTETLVCSAYLNTGGAHVGYISFGIIAANDCDGAIQSAGSSIAEYYGGNYIGSSTNLSGTCTPGANGPVISFTFTGTINGSVNANLWVFNSPKTGAHDYVHDGSATFN